MPPSDTGSQSIATQDKLKVMDYDGKDKSFIVTSPTGHTLRVSDTFAEIFPMWAGRVLITAENEKWALTAARAAVGFATSIIMSPAEAAIEKTLSPEKTPDNRPGVVIQIYNRTLRELKRQMIRRTGQCVMTCSTTAAYDALPNVKRRLKVGRRLRLFGDGFQKKGEINGRKVWRIPVMEGEFVVKNSFGATKAAAGGTLLLMAESQRVGLQAAMTVVDTIRSKVEEVIMPFPGGICRSGSKVGSMKYRLGASTNHPFCPRLREALPDSQVPEGVECIYEIVINGLTLEAVRKAMFEGIKAASQIPGLTKISAANFGGKLGPYKIQLKEALGT
jgi:formylmethanofuran--tetrahydromethanopterin N-formyltransferase